MIELFRKLRLRFAAKQYALRLGGSLQQSFGPSSTYTPKQIQRGISDCSLDTRYIVFGYAAFLSEEEFNARLSDMAVRLSYEEARDLYFRFFRPKATPVAGSVQGVGEPSMPGGNGSAGD